jgi:FkbM family methyltransferase
MEIEIYGVRKIDNTLKPKMQSYSQCQEDIFLYERYFKEKRHGTFIELGALDGLLYSNTKMYEDFLEWKGVLIEPHPYQFQKLQGNRPRCHLFNELVSNTSDALIFRYFVEGHAAVSGVADTMPQILLDLFYQHPDWELLPKGEMRLVPKTLTEILSQTPFTHFDLLSLDVEGHEYEVLQSWDFSIPIHVILIESLGVVEKDALCEELLVRNGYRFDTNYKHNRVFVLDTFVGV